MVRIAGSYLVAKVFVCCKVAVFAAFGFDFGKGVTAEQVADKLHASTFF